MCHVHGQNRSKMIKIDQNRTNELFKADSAVASSFSWKGRLATRDPSVLIWVRFCVVKTRARHSIHLSLTARSMPTQTPGRCGITSLAATATDWILRRFVENRGWLNIWKTSSWCSCTHLSMASEKGWSLCRILLAPRYEEYVIQPWPHVCWVYRGYVIFAIELRAWLLALTPPV